MRAFRDIVAREVLAVAGQDGAAQLRLLPDVLDGKRRGGSLRVNGETDAAARRR